MNKAAQQVFTLEEFEIATAQVKSQRQELILLVCNTTFKEQASILFKHLEDKNHGTDKKKIKSSEICHMVQGFGVQEMPKEIKTNANIIFTATTALEGKFKVEKSKEYPWGEKQIWERVQGEIIQIEKSFVKRPFLISTNSLYVIREAYKASKDKDWKITLLYQDGKKVEQAESFEDLIEKVGF